MKQSRAQESYKREARHRSARHACYLSALFEFEGSYSVGLYIWLQPEFYCLLSSSTGAVVTSLSDKPTLKDVGYGIYYRPQCIIGHRIFSTVERISSRSAQICSTGNTKTDYIKTRRIRFFLPWREGLKRVLRKYLFSS